MTKVISPIQTPLFPHPPEILRNRENQMYAAPLVYILATLAFQTCKNK